jgi:hypothetical protein
MSGSCDPTKRRVVLHIGTAKTGTSSIQMFLVRNAEALAAQGILVPASPLSGLRGAQSHRKLAAYALGARRGAKSRELLDIEDLPRFRDAFARNSWRNANHRPPPSSPCPRSICPHVWTGQRK